MRLSGKYVLSLQTGSILTVCTAFAARSQNTNGGDESGVRLDSVNRDLQRVSAACSMHHNEFAFAKRHIVLLQPNSKH
jgi:hypothetical protein